MGLLSAIRALRSGRGYSTSVAFHRFGLPGDELDDRPPPSLVHVAAYDAEGDRRTCRGCVQVDFAASVALVWMWFVISVINGFTEGFKIPLNWIVIYIPMCIATIVGLYVIVKKRSQWMLFPCMCHILLTAGWSSYTIYYLLVTLQRCVLYSYTFETPHDAIVLSILVLGCVGNYLGLFAMVRYLRYMWRSARQERVDAVVEAIQLKYPGISVVIVDRGTKLSRQPTPDRYPGVEQVTAARATETEDESRLLFSSSSA